MSHVHSTAVVAHNVSIGENVYIGPYCIIGLPGHQLSPSGKGASEGATVIGSNSVVMGNTVICRGARIGTQCRMDYGSFVGENTIIGNFALIELGARVYNDVHIGEDCTVAGFVCNGCVIGNRSIVHGDLIHSFVNVGPDGVELPRTVNCDCFIGRAAMVIGSIIVAEGTYVGASSVVTRTTVGHRLYLGNPARDCGPAPKSYIGGNAVYNRTRNPAIYERLCGYSCP
jgi:acetyltransferase-like isoleucine patch superfamily enzyme